MSHFFERLRHGLSALGDDERVINEVDPNTLNAAKIVRRYCEALYENDLEYKGPLF